MNVDRSTISLGIVCPMANERDTAEDFVRAVLSACPGFKSVTFFAVLDNVCKDGTVDLLRTLAQTESRLNVVWAPENRCVVDAYVRGYHEALDSGCDWILEIDAGFSHHPDDLPAFFEKMEQGYDCVFGSRFMPGGSMGDSPLKRRIISKGGTLAANLLLGTRLKDMTSGFELFARRALVRVLEIGIQSRGHFFQTEIKTHCRKMNYAEVPIRYTAPSAGVNSSVLRDAARHLFRLFFLRIQGRL